jgi:hypothetical protein
MREAKRRGREGESSEALATQCKEEEGVVSRRKAAAGRPSRVASRERSWRGGEAWVERVWGRPVRVGQARGSGRRDRGMVGSWGGRLLAHPGGL